MAFDLTKPRSGAGEVQQEQPQQLSPAETLERRLATFERLLSHFRWERVTYIVISTGSFFMLLFAAGSLILKGHAGAVELGSIFGSGGVITYSTGRLLRMWDQALKVVYGTGSVPN